MRRMAGERIRSRPRDADVPLFLQMQKDLMSRFLGQDVRRIDADGGMLGRLVWIGDPGELLDDTSARFGVESFKVPLLTDFEGS